MKRYLPIVVVVGLVAWLGWVATHKAPPAPLSAPASATQSASAESGASSTPDGTPAALTTVPNSSPSGATGPAGLPAAGLAHPFHTLPARKLWPYGADAGTAVITQNNGAKIYSDVADLARQLNDPHTEPGHDLETIQKLLEIYRKANGVNPTGFNFEIVDALRGDNPIRYAVIPEDMPSLNADGELLDRWGTPYWFHPISGQVMDVRSAGPDQKLWTEDDISLPMGYEQ